MYTWDQEFEGGFSVADLSPLMLIKWKDSRTLISIEDKGEGFELKWNVKKQEFVETHPTLEDALKRGAIL